MATFSKIGGKDEIEMLLAYMDWLRMPTEEFQKKYSGKFRDSVKPKRHADDLREYFQVLLDERKKGL